MQLVNASNSVVGSTATDANGTFSFTGIGPGTFTIREVVQTGWTQTATPVPPGTYTFTASSGTNITGKTFGDVFQYISISGTVYDDANGDATQNNGEPGLQGWTVQLVGGGNTVVGTATTDANGNYTIPNVGAGTYSLREVLQAGYAQTMPATPGGYTVTPNGSVNITGENFGNFQTVSVSGNVFNDLNGDAIQNNNDPGLQGWTVQVVNASNAVVGSATTDASGNYTITGIGPGTMTVREVAQYGWLQTAPTPVPPGTYTFTATEGVNLTGETFGNIFQFASISGTVYNDLNGNAFQDNNDPGLQGWTVQLVDGSNAVIGSAITDVNGNYTISNVGLATYTLREVSQAGYLQPRPPCQERTRLPPVPRQHHGRIFRELSARLVQRKSVQRSQRRRGPEQWRTGRAGLDRAIGQRQQYRRRLDHDRCQRQLLIYGRRTRRMDSSRSRTSRLATDESHAGSARHVHGYGYQRNESQ